MTPTHFRTAAAAAFAGAILLAAPAFAFTVQDAGGSSGGSSLNSSSVYNVSPTDTPVRQGTVEQNRGLQIGNGTLNFNTGQNQFNQRYDSGSYFDMNRTLGR